jgi:hypothetical protein
MSKETIFGIVINVCFVLTIFAVRYYFVKQEYDFLVNDSQRQEELIVENEFTIDTLKTEVAKLNKYNVKLINEMQDVKTNYYERIRWEKEYEQRLKNLRESLDSVKFEVSFRWRE